MTLIEPMKWLLLIHQIPPKPNALRVKIWRRLQQVGAVSIKQSVYAMPLSDEAREDLSWTLKEIVAGGGDGSISEVRFLEGITDEQVIALFRKARKADYEKVIQDIHLLLADLDGDEADRPEPPARGHAQVGKLARRLEEITAIDFFQTPERQSALGLLGELEARLSGRSPAAPAAEDLEGLRGKTWVTRKNLFVDRIACAWLIRRYVDDGAVFRFVDKEPHAALPGEIRFDMFEGEYTHEGDCCTFEVMIRRLRLADRALVPLAEVVHDIDLKDGKYGRSEKEGFGALLTGMAASQPEDAERLVEGFRLFDNLHAYFERQGGKRAD